MGLAASQARLLLLTARKSDLEFRAQQITNAEMVLAMQSEEVAREYSMKLSNQTLKYLQPGSSQAVEITAASLSALTSGTMKLQLIKPDASGNPTWEDWKAEEKLDGYQDENGNFITEDEYNKLSATEQAGYNAVYQVVGNNYDGPQILAGLQNGTMRIVNAAGKDIDAYNNISFSVTYDTSDDAQADAEYRRKTSALQVKEKRLQMDLSKVETQQKACDTEIESVKKVMQKNIETTFKVFS